jgi:hypothetical protein
MEESASLSFFDRSRLLTWGALIGLLVAGIGLRLINLRTGAYSSLEFVTALAWLIGGLLIYALSRQISSTMGALICLAYYYLLPLGIIIEKNYQTSSLVVVWLTIAIYGLYKLIAKRRLYWAVWIVICLVTLIIESFLSDSFPLGHPNEWMRLLVSPIFYLHWFEQLHGNLDLFLVLISAAAIFLLSKPVRNYLLSIWLIYGIAALTFPEQAMNNAYFHQLLVPIVALSLGVLGSSFYQEISKRGQVWQVLLLAVFALAVIISTGYAFKRVLNAAELNTILHPLKRNLFADIDFLWLLLASA